MTSYLIAKLHTVYARSCGPKLAELMKRWVGVGRADLERRFGSETSPNHNLNQTSPCRTKRTTSLRTFSLSHSKKIPEPSPKIQLLLAIFAAHLHNDLATPVFKLQAPSSQPPASTFNPSPNATASNCVPATLFGSAARAPTIHLKGQYTPSHLSSSASS